jgi:hypothetical protein
MAMLLPHSLMRARRRLRPIVINTRTAASAKEPLHTSRQGSRLRAGFSSDRGNWEPMKQTTVAGAEQQRQGDEPRAVSGPDGMR